MREPGLEPDALESPVLAKREEHELMKRRIFLSAALALVCIACGAAERTPRNGLIAADWQGEGIYLVDPANTDRQAGARSAPASLPRHITRKTPAGEVIRESSHEQRAPAPP